MFRDPVFGFLVVVVVSGVEAVVDLVVVVIIVGFFGEHPLPSTQFLAFGS